MHIRWNDRLVAPTTAIKSNKANKTVSTTDLYQALLPIYHLSKVWGLLPVKFEKQLFDRYKGHVHFLGVIYSIFVLGVIIAGQMWGLWRDFKDGWLNSTRLRSPTALIVTGSDIGAIVTLTSISILGSPLRWKHLQSIMDKLVQIDGKIGLLCPRKTQAFSIVLTGCTLVYLFACSSLDIYTWECETISSKKMSDKGAINYCPIYVMYIVIFMMEIQYAVITYNVGQRFARLNKVLENILKCGTVTDHFRRDLVLAGDLKDQRQPLAYVEQDLGIAANAPRKGKHFDWGNDEKATQNVTETISKMIQVHSKLCDAVEELNKAYGLAILCTTVTCLLHLIITPYFLLMQANGQGKALFLMVQGMWCILHVGRLLIIVQPPHQTSTQAKQTAVLVSRLLFAHKNLEMRKQLEIFSLQLLHRPLDFSACGLFSMNRGLVTSIAGAVTTYLVILIQFQKADDTKGDYDNILKNATLILKNTSSLFNSTFRKQQQ